MTFPSHAQIHTGGGALAGESLGRKWNSWIMEFEYRVVDVFTDVALEGNPLAVFADARGLPEAMMAKIARELNLSETTFVLPATRHDCAAKVRIFTPGAEMRFAGHPTIGTAYVLRESGRVPKSEPSFALEEGVGPVHVRADDDGLLWLLTPDIERGQLYDRAACARSLGLDETDLIPDVPCRMLTAGNPNVYIALRDKAAVDRAWVERSALRSLAGESNEPPCIFVFTPTAEGAYSRMFAPEYGIVEDPATGSATGPLAAFMMDNGLVRTASGTRFVSEQGTKMGRRSLLHVLVHGEGGSDGIEVGGRVAPLARATMKL